MACMCNFSKNFAVIEGDFIIVVWLIELKYSYIWIFFIKYYSAQNMAVTDNNRFVFAKVVP